MADLIEQLSAYPMDSTVVIDDADTSWFGPVIHHSFDEARKEVTLWIEYNEMVRPQK